MPVRSAPVQTRGGVEPTGDPKDSSSDLEQDLAAVRDNSDLWALACHRLLKSDEKLNSALEEYFDGPIDYAHVRSAYEKSLKERNSKQWHIKMFGHDLKIREKVDGLLKFAAWSDKLVSSALTAQPISQLAWTAVSITLPVCTIGKRSKATNLVS